MLRVAGMFFQTLWMTRIIAAFSVIEGLWRDVKVATGEAGIVTMRVVVINHLSLCIACFDSFGMLARRLAPGIMLPYTLIVQPLYFPLILQVSPIYLN